uniref:Uncharacterized protein n=2 Tax=Anguilla anguilla TaxID=7936 RepID=A0A0E9X5Z4_ANGAN
MSLLLNQLLCFPLPEPECAWLYRGTLVHQVVKEMKEGKAPEDLLQGPHLPGQLFRDLMGAVQSSVGAGFFTKKWRKTGQRQAQEQQQNHTESPQATQDTSNSSAQLECDDDRENEDNYDGDDHGDDCDDDDSNDDDQEEDQQCWEPASPVRVRFVTTCRTNRTRDRVRVRKPHRVMW